MNIIEAPDIACLGTGSSTNLYESSTVVQGSVIVLKLIEYPDASCAVIRQLTRGDAGIFTQVAVLETVASVDNFAQADTHVDALRMQYEKLRAAFDRISRTSKPVAVDIEDPLRAIGRISTCRTQGEVVQLTRHIVAALGAEQFLFQWFRFPGGISAIGEASESEYLIGCRTDWVQRYLGKLWYMSDPLLEHARYSGTPAGISTLQMHRTDHWLTTEAHKYGFRSTAIFPVRGNDVLGMLLVSNADPPAAGEPALLAQKVLFRALSNELFDWRTHQARAAAIASFGLSAEDATVLRTLRRGGAAHNVAEWIGCPVRAVYRTIYPRINAKFGVNRISDAVDKAESLGLVD